MSIVDVVVESIHGDKRGVRFVYFSAIGSDGDRHPYGPVITSDPAFDPEVCKTAVKDKIEEALAEQELEDFLNG